MTKKLFFSAIAFCFAWQAFAGGLLTNTNQSVHFLRNPARDASTEIDAVYTNPAGLSLLPVDGFHFALTNQSAFQTREITTTYAPFKGFGGNDTKTFKGEASAPIVPSVQAAYKKGDWVLSGSIAVTGGGGKATFNEGLPSFESQIAMVPVGLNMAGIPTTLYSVDSYMEGSSFIYGAQLGGTYKINDLFSAYAGFRMNIVNNSYVGHLKDIKINPEYSAVGFTGTMISAETVFNTLAAVYTAQGNVDGAKEMKDNAEAVADKYLDCDQSGWGVTPVLGLNFNWNALNVGVKYEFRTNLNVENKTKIDDTGLFKHGVNTPHDIPSLLTVGVQYDIIPAITVSAGYHRFFDSNASMALVTDPYTGNKVGKENFIDGGTNEYLGGVEWRIDRLFLISGGFQFTRYGISDEYQQDLSFSLNSYSVGIGGAVNVSERVRVNIGYFFTNYSDWTKESANYNGTSMPGKDVFSRTNKVFGAGVDFRF